MRLDLILAFGAVAALLITSPADAQLAEPGWPSAHTLSHGHSPDISCKNAKLRAADAYTSCLIRVLSERKDQGRDRFKKSIAWCDATFNRAFGLAEAHGDCHTPGGASTIREPIKAQVLRTATHLSNGPTCTTTPGETAVCQFDSTTTAVDIATLVSELSGYGVSANTAFWIEAWGGDGSDGNVCCDFGGTGGQGGYAQMTTNLTAFNSQFGTTEIYYYLGLNGTYSANAGGDGGTATLLTTNDLFENDASLDDTLLIAGGGGGGGAGRGEEHVCPGTSAGYVFGENAGNGGIVFPPSSAQIVVGQDGTNNYGTGRSGQGGQTMAGGTAGFGSSFNGGGPLAPLGGRGGNHDNPSVGFVNASATKVSGVGGQGQDGGYDAGGGGGGGGYTGGGGGVRGFGDSCVSGAGGGGSSFVRVPANSPTCAAAPKERPSNPSGGAGFVQIVFDLGACE
jgi:hypothetical protein